MLVFTLFCAYVAVAAGFYTMLTRTAVEGNDEMSAVPTLFLVEGGAESVERRAA